MIIQKKTYPTLLVFLIVMFSNIRAYEYSVGIGNITEHVGKIQTDESGSLNTISFNPLLNASLHYRYDQNLSFSPEIGTTIPKSGTDSNIKHMSFYALFNTRYHYEDFFLSAGPGIYFSRVWGIGGTESLNNGTGTTAFPLPDTSSIARNTIVNLGTGYYLKSNIHAELNTFVFNLLSNDDRAFSWILNLSYYFGEIK
jgi:hypothetical protein